jgi:hypothetical protein
LPSRFDPAASAPERRRLLHGVHKRGTPRDIASIELRANNELRVREVAQSWRTLILVYARAETRVFLPSTRRKKALRASSAKKITGVQAKTKAHSRQPMGAVLKTPCRKGR